MLDEVKQSGGQADGAGDRFDKLGGIVKGHRRTYGRGAPASSTTAYCAQGCRRTRSKTRWGPCCVPQLQGLADEGVTLLWDLSSWPHGSRRGIGTKTASWVPGIIKERHEPDLLTYDSIPEKKPVQVLRIFLHPLENLPRIENKILL